MNALIVPAEIAYPSMEKAKNASFAYTLAEGYTLVDLHTRRVDNGEEGKQGFDTKLLQKATHKQNHPTDSAQTRNRKYCY